MKRIILFLLTICAVGVSCTKSVKVPMSYTVENEKDTTPQNVYITATGKAYVDLTVKFLSGTPDSVTLEVQGIPNGITVSPQRSTGIPTYYYKYIYTANNIAVGTYPISIVATAPGTATQVYNYNLIVIPADCASLFIGNLTGSNGCTSRSYTYPVTGVSSGTTNVLTVNNFGGYGSNTSVNISLNCDIDSLYIPSQNIGNGITMQGSGTFTSSGMNVYYTVSGAVSESCSATLSK